MIDQFAQCAAGAWFGVACGCPRGLECARSQLRPDRGFICIAHGDVLDYPPNASKGSADPLVNLSATANSTPTPTPWPTCNTTAKDPGFGPWLDSVGKAYESVFNVTPTFEGYADRRSSFVEHSAGYATQMDASAGWFNGFMPTDNRTYVNVTDWGCLKREAAVVDNTRGGASRTYDFKFFCYDRTYQLDVRVSEDVPAGREPKGLGARLAQRTAIACPD